MKKILLIGFLFVVLILSTNKYCYAQMVAVEVRGNGKFSNIIGMADVNISNGFVEVVTFGQSFEGDIRPHAFIYKILEQTIVEKEVIHLKCQTQTGSIYVGTINKRDRMKPLIMLKSDSLGLVLTNISEDGQDFKKEYLPGIYLGK